MTQTITALHTFVGAEYVVHFTRDFLGNDIKFFDVWSFVAT